MVTKGVRNIAATLDIRGRLDKSFPNAVKKSQTSLKTLKKAQADERDEYKLTARELKRYEKGSKEALAAQKKLGMLDRSITNRGKEIRGLSLSTEGAASSVGLLTNSFTKLGLVAGGVGVVAGGIISTFIGVANEIRQIEDLARGLDITHGKFVAVQRAVSIALGRSKEEASAFTAELFSLTQQLNNPLYSGDLLQTFDLAGIDITLLQDGTTPVEFLDVLLSQANSADWLVLRNNLDSNFIIPIQQASEEVVALDEVVDNSFDNIKELTDKQKERIARIRQVQQTFSTIFDHVKYNLFTTGINASNFATDLPYKLRILERSEPPAAAQPIRLSDSLTESGLNQLANNTSTVEGNTQNIDINIVVQGGDNTELAEMIGNKLTEELALQTTDRLGY